MYPVMDPTNVELDYLLLFNVGSLFDIFGSKSIDWQMCVFMNACNMRYDNLAHFWYVIVDLGCLS